MAIAEGITGPVATPAPSRWKRAKESLRIFVASKVAVAGFFLVAFWVIVAVFADDCTFRPSLWIGCLTGQREVYSQTTPWLARYSPLEQFRGENLQGPSAAHWLGTDRQGRDLWARLAHGSRIILLLAPFSILIALVVGGTLGVIAGYYGGLTDEITMRLLDALMAFPQILLYLVIIAALGPSITNIIIAITIAGAPGIARLVRSLTLDIKTRDFVAAAETRGESPWYIMFVEILPNARGPIIIDVMLRIGYAVFAIGTLGFLGLGLPPPSPDWGSLVNQGRSFIQAGHPWDALWASLAIAMLVVGLNLMADGLNEETQRYR